MNKTLLVIGFVWPEPNSSAAGGRMLQLISLFQAQGYAVTFSSPAMDSDFSIDFEALAIAKKTIALNCSSFDVYIKELQPSVILFDRFMMEEQFGWRVAEHCPAALRIIDTEDLHCLRKARQNACKEKRLFVLTDLFLEDVAKREIASILRCDLALIIAEYEMEILQTVFKIDASLLYYLPFLVPPIDAAAIQKTPSFEQRTGFIFIGNFLHEPNWNAVQYLKETIWPLLKKQFSQAVLQVYGAYPSQKVLQLHQPTSGFYVLGRAPNAQEVVQAARVVLAPLRFGAGQKGKLLEAMQCGTPSVTTTIGAESMCGYLPWNGFVTDDPDLFVTQAIRLYEDKFLWQQAQQNGFEINNKRYLKRFFEADFDAKIRFLIVNLAQHRSANFLGSVLRHHTLNSTKYMSKWIEAKNNGGLSTSL
ncbi:glycosyltransferase [Flavobacterium restrictum]|uniref:Glycosyltransferase family 4 protein n=1 Tax=Flavobacterium restrictum TaxID=2594428 RepID=A0A553E1U3_9FLAO|nr:glycosyltransferase [Flavobacterium restrictum]TRX38960.1 glycosyltransferase family 4 protein [Flavobacterium restrictum]